MTYNQLKAKPGDYIFNSIGLAVGRINTDTTEDNRWTADGKCSIANGFIKATGISPSDAKRFHNSVSTNPNAYLLKGYTIVLQLKELPIEMWAVTASEILGSEYNDFQEMLEALSKQPELERQAKLHVMEKFFKKERTALKKKTTISKAGKRIVDAFVEKSNKEFEESGKLHNCAPDYGLNKLTDLYLDGKPLDVPMSFLFGPYGNYDLQRITDKNACYKYFDEVAIHDLKNPIYSSPEAIAKLIWDEDKEGIEAMKFAFVALITLKKKPEFSKYTAHAFAHHYYTWYNFTIPELTDDIQKQVEKKYRQMLRSEQPMKDTDVRHRYFSYMGRFYSRPELAHFDTQCTSEYLEDYKQYLRDNE